MASPNSVLKEWWKANAVSLQRQMKRWHDNIYKWLDMNKLNISLPKIENFGRYLVMLMHNLS